VLLLAGDEDAALPAAWVVWFRTKVIDGGATSASNSNEKYGKAIR